MENRSHAIIAVTFLLVFSLGAIVVYYWLANRHDEPRVYQIVTTQSVSGLAEQSPVRFKGLPIGHITHIGFDPHDRSRVIVRMHLKPDAYVTHATYAQIAMQGLTGGSVLELKLGKGPRTPLPTHADDPAHIPLHPSLLASLTQSARKDMDDLHDILASARSILGPANRQHLQATLQQIDTATRRLASLEKQLAPTIKQLPELTRSLQQSIDQSHALLAHADQLAQSAQTPIKHLDDLETSVQSLVQSSHRLSQRLDRQTAPDIRQLSQSLLRTSQQLQALLRELTAKPQSLLFGAPQQPPGPGEPGFDPQRSQKPPPEPSP